MLQTTQSRFFFQNMFKSMIIFDMDRLYQYKKTHVFTK